jgi:replicative DNA helicase
MIPDSEAVHEKFLMEYNGPDRVVPLAEALRLTQARGGIRLKTGIKELDDLAQGIETGELIVISGPTKNGKTTLMETISHHVSTTEDTAIQTVPLWFSFEVNIHQFARKYNGQMPDIRVPLQLMQNSASWLEEKIWEAKLKYGSHVVFIDHLHFIADILQSKNPSMDIGKIMRSLKSMALKHGVVIFLAAHTGKRRLNDKEEINSNDIRDSSFIPQEADTTWMVRRCEAVENAAWLIVCNHRRTGVMNGKIKLVKVGNFLEMGIWEDPRKKLRKEDDYDYTKDF